MLAFVLMTSAFFVDRYFTPVNKQIESIAGLPFANASGNAELDYLPDGVCESVIDRLPQSYARKRTIKTAFFVEM